MKIKVCGMKYLENIQDVASLKPDFMGFIFYAKSPRYALGLCAESVRSLPVSIKRVGVFVNESQDVIEALIDKYGFDYVQLHADESPEFCRMLRTKCGVIKAVSVCTGDDILRATKLYDDSVDFMLFDTKTSMYGGSGVQFDWALLDLYAGNSPFFLSGGISADNINQIKKITHPKLYALDLNSRFETEPGMKNIEQLKMYIYEQN